MKVVAAVLPKFTAVTPLKFVPWMITVVPPPAKMLLGPGMEPCDVRARPNAQVSWGRLHRVGSVGQDV